MPDNTYAYTAPPSAPRAEDLIAQAHVLVGSTSAVAQAKAQIAIAVSLDSIATSLGEILVLLNNATEGSGAVKVAGEIVSFDG